MSLARYLKTLLATVLLLSVLAMALPVVRRAHVSVGDKFDEQLVHEFTLEAGHNRFYEVNDTQVKKLEQGIRILGTGPVRLLSAQVRVVPKQLSWKENKRRITAPGGELTATVQWEVVEDENPRGEINLTFPGVQPKFRSGDYRAGGGHWTVRAITAHTSLFSLLLGRLAVGFEFAFWPALLIHSLWVSTIFSRKNRELLASAPPADGAPLPRTFLPKPYAEYESALIWVVILGFIGSFVSVLGMFHGAMLEMTMWINLVILGVAIIAALLSLWIVPTMTRTVQVSLDRLAISKGRSQKKWAEASWREIRSLEAKERRVKNGTQQWLEVIFPDGKKHKIRAQSVLEYPILVQLATALHRSHRVSPGAPSGNPDLSSY